MSLNATYRRAILDMMFGQGVLEPPETIYVGLTFDEPDLSDNSFTEPTDPAYERFEMDNDKTSWNAAADDAVSNKIPVSFPTATTDWSATGEIRYFILSTTQYPDTAGVFACGELLAYQDVGIGDTVTFPIDALVCRLETLPEDNG